MNSQLHYDALDSDQPATIAMMATSRKGAIQKPSSLCTPSKRLKSRDRRWKRRQALRLANCAIDPTYSDDESVLPPIIPSRARTPKNLAAFKSLPRPSELVCAIEEGDDLDSGLPQSQKEAHRRRIDATALCLEHLDRCGLPAAVAVWSRSRRGLQKYTAFLHPPEEDRHIPLLRTPPQLLSSYYRGTLLTVHKLGIPRRTPKRRKPPKRRHGNSSHAIDSMSEDLISSTTASEAEENNYYETLDARPPSTSVEIAERRAKWAKVKEKVEKRFQKDQFLNQFKVSAQNEDDSPSSGSDGSHISSATPISQPTDIRRLEEARNKSQNTDETKPVESKDELLLRLLQGDVEDVLGFGKTEDNTVHAEGEGEAATGSNADLSASGRAKKQTSQMASHDKARKPMTTFEKEKEAAMAFCQATGKLTRAERYLHAAKLLGKKTHKREDDDPISGSSQAPLSQAVVNIMKKMGFKGRLGAKENGPAVPLQAKRIKGRSGIGAKPAEALVHERGTAYTSIQRQMAYSMISDSKSYKRSRTNGVPTPTQHLVPFPSKANLNERISRPRKRSRVTEVVGKKAGFEGNQSGCANAHVSKRRSHSVRDQKEKSAPDPEDEYETEGDAFVDNMRRGIIVDMGAIVKNSHQRRVKAFENLCKMSGDLLSVPCGLNDLYNELEHDLTDAEGITILLKRSGIPATEKVRSKLMERLDGCYERLGPVELVESMKKTKLCESLNYAVVHCGSQSRMERELQQLEIENGAVICTVLKDTDSWPYLKSWREVFCRLGISPRQGSLVPFKASKWSAGEVAGIVLKSQSIICVASGSDWISHGATENITIDVAEAFSAAERGLSRGILSSTPRRKRVLFHSKNDNLWHAGLVEFESGTQAFVRYCGYDKLEWVEGEIMLGLRRADYQKLKKSDFADLLEPGDIEIL